MGGFRTVRRRKNVANAAQVCRRSGRSGVLSFAGSMTLECAAVLPLFFMTVLTLILFMNAVSLQVEASLRLSNRARKLSMAAGAAQGDKRPEAWIDLAENRTFDYPFSLPGIPKLKIAVRARVYPWTGMKGGLRSRKRAGSVKEEMVLVTENESVWHTHADCTHLDLSVYQSTTARIGTLRNVYGRRYRRCPGFPEGYQGTVYATAKGRYYYPSSSYGSLTRHVRMVKKQSVADLKECERCAARDRAGKAG